MDITERIKELCKERDWTYYKLAAESHMPHSSLHAMLNRDGDPSIKNLTKICAGFGISLAEFFNGMEENNSKDDLQEIINLWNSLNSSEKQFAKIYMYGLACRDAQ